MDTPLSSGIPSGNANSNGSSLPPSQSPSSPPTFDLSSGPIASIPSTSISAPKPLADTTPKLTEDAKPAPQIMDNTVAQPAVKLDLLNLKQPLTLESKIPPELPSQFQLTPNETTPVLSIKQPGFSPLKKGLLVAGILVVLITGGVTLYYQFLSPNLKGDLRVNPQTPNKDSQVSELIKPVSPVSLNGVPIVNIPSQTPVNTSPSATPSLTPVSPAQIAQDNSNQSRDQISGNSPAVLAPISTPEISGNQTPTTEPNSNATPTSNPLRPETPVSTEPSSNATPTSDGSTTPTTAQPSRDTSTPQPTRDTSTPPTPSGLSPLTSSSDSPQPQQQPVVAIGQTEPTATPSTAPRTPVSCSAGQRLDQTRNQCVCDSSKGYFELKLDGAVSTEFSTALTTTTSQTVVCLSCTQVAERIRTLQENATLLTDSAKAELESLTRMAQENKCSIPTFQSPNSTGGTKSDPPTSPSVQPPSNSPAPSSAPDVKPPPPQDNNSNNPSAAAPAPGPVAAPPGPVVSPAPNPSPNSSPNPSPNAAPAVSPVPTPSPASSPNPGSNPSPDNGSSAKPPLVAADNPTSPNPSAPAPTPSVEQTSDLTTNLPPKTLSTPISEENDVSTKSSQFSTSAPAPVVALDPNTELTTLHGAASDMVTQEITQTGPEWSLYLIAAMMLGYWVQRRSHQKATAELKK